MEKNPIIYSNRHPCHILHNSAKKNADAFSKVCDFDGEEFISYFDKSTKREKLSLIFLLVLCSKLQVYCKKMCLFLVESCIERCLMQYAGIK